MLGAIAQSDCVFGHHYELLWLGPSLGVVKARAIFGSGNVWAISGNGYVWGLLWEWLCLGPSLGVAMSGAISGSGYVWGHPWAWLQSRVPLAGPRS